MAKLQYGYGWVLKFLLAAILIGVGVYMVFADEVVYIITGVAIVVFSIFRVVPLIKSLHKESLRTINLIEIIFDSLIGIMLIYVAASGRIQTEAIWADVYRFALAFFFYARGLVFFNSVVFLEEKTEIPKFWVHIGALTLGTVIAISGSFGYETVGIFFLIISLIGAGYLSIDGYGGYKKYREHSAALNLGKEKQKEQQKQPNVEKELPTTIKDEKEERPYVN
ncbi:MAG: hypothetical protein ACNA7K_05495 [Acholeplasmataceae bacterium]